MTLKYILDCIPYDEHIEVDKYARTQNGNYFEKIYSGRKMDFAVDFAFDLKKYANAKLYMISTLPDQTGTTLYIVIE